MKGKIFPPLALLMLTIVLLAVFLSALFESVRSRDVVTSGVAGRDVSALLGVTQSATSSLSVRYFVLHVVDGDTLDIDMDGTKTRLRLIGINTPETVDPRRPVECFGKEASAKAKELLEGKMVSIEYDPSQDKYDKYGRLLVYVYLPDGSFFNERMIREGYAHEYTYRFPYKYQREFKQAENEARAAHRGLWREGVCGTTSM